MAMTPDAFSLIGDALIAITEYRVHRDNEETERAEDCLASAVNLLVQARDALRPPAVPQAAGA